MKMKRMVALIMAVLLICLAVTPALADPGNGNAYGHGNSGVAGEVTHTPTPTPDPTPTVTPTVQPTTAPSTNPGDNDLFHRWGLDKEENQVNPPKVTTDDVQNWVDRKGNDAITILQNVVKVVSIIGFILCICLIIIGAVGNRRTMTGGIIGAIVAALCYVAISQIDVILAFFSGWIMS